MAAIGNAMYAMHWPAVAPLVRILEEDDALGHRDAAAFALGVVGSRNAQASLKRARRQREPHRGGHMVMLAQLTPDREIVDEAVHRAASGRTRRFLDSVFGG